MIHRETFDFWLPCIRRALLVACVFGFSGCSAFRSIDATPLEECPAHIFQHVERAHKQPIDLRLLGQTPPSQHYVADNDVLGIYIEGILGPDGSTPPINFPAERSRSPSLGYPVPVRSGGRIELPIAGTVDVNGLSLSQIESKLRHTFTVTHPLLKPGRDRIHVSLQKARSVRVLVVRQEAFGGPRRIDTGQFTPDEDHRTGHAVELPIYHNDVLTALVRTGGMPRSEAENAVYVFRRGQTRGSTWNGATNPPVSHAATPWGWSVEPQHMTGGPQYGTGFVIGEPSAHPGAIRIPLRVVPGTPVSVSQSDVILQDGDIVLLEARETDYFFTAGLLGGGQYALPRDYDLNVIDAISLAESTGMQAFINRPTRAIGGVSVLNRDVTVGASQVVIERKTAEGRNRRILVDLYQAMKYRSHRVRIQPGDRLYLEYSKKEAFWAFFERHFLDGSVSGAPTIISSH